MLVSRLRGCRLHHSGFVAPLLSLCICLLTAGSVYCQTDSSQGGANAAAPNANAVPPKALQYGLTLDSVYSGNLNHPANGTNALRNFDTNADAAALTIANVDLQYTRGKFGFHLDAGGGQAYQTMALADRVGGVNRYVGQLYASYKPFEKSSFQLDFGKFYTSAGAEVVDVLSDYNYSRSLLFTLGLPYNHFGIRATVPLTPTFNVGAQLIDGWNGVKDPNIGTSLVLTSALTRPRWSWTQMYLTGPEKGQANRGSRQFFDEVVTVSPRTWMQAYVEALGGFQPGTPGEAAQGSRDYWTGVAGAVRFSPTKTLSFSPRLEFYNDGTGYTSGLPQRLSEFTGTVEYRPRPILTFRMEYRADHSNQPFFDEGSHPGTRRSQQTVALAVILALKGER